LPRATARPLSKPLLLSLALHAIVLVTIVVCLPPRQRPSPARTLHVRLEGEAPPDDERRLEDDTWQDEQIEVREHAVDLPDFDVLLPPADVEDRSEDDVLPEEDPPRASSEPPLEDFHVPAGATRRPPPPAPKPVPRMTRPKPRAAPAKPRPRRGAVLRVVRRPGMRGHYPIEARRRGLEGTTLVLVRVAPSGQVVDARVQKSSGHASLDRAALRVARLYEFAPGTPGRALLPVRFRLTD